jgi:hypothetical protein
MASICANDRGIYIVLALHWDAVMAIIIGDIHGDLDLPSLQARGGACALDDAQWEPQHPPDPRVKQIFDHTQVEGPIRNNNQHQHSHRGWLVFDTENEEFVRLGP